MQPTLVRTNSSLNSQLLHKAFVRNHASSHFPESEKSDTRRTQQEVQGGASQKSQSRSKEAICLGLGLWSAPSRRATPPLKSQTQTPLEESCFLHSATTLSHVLPSGTAQPCYLWPTLMPTTWTCSIHSNLLTGYWYITGSGMLTVYWYITKHTYIHTYTHTVPHTHT